MSLDREVVGYEAPRLTKLGTLDELTHGIAGPNPDGLLGTGFGGGGGGGGGGGSIIP